MLLADHSVVCRLADEAYFDYVEMIENYFKYEIHKAFFNITWLLLRGTIWYYTVIYKVAKVILRYTAFSTDPYLIITVVIILLRLKQKANSKYYKESKSMVFSSFGLMSIVFISYSYQWLLFLPVLNFILATEQHNFSLFCRPLLCSLEDSLNLSDLFR